jgi:hypothetical protein
MTASKIITIQSHRRASSLQLPPSRFADVTPRGTLVRPHATFSLRHHFCRDRSPLTGREGRDGPYVARTRHDIIDLALSNCAAVSSTVVPSAGGCGHGRRHTASLSQIPDAFLPSGLQGRLPLPASTLRWREANGPPSKVRRPALGEPVAAGAGAISPDVLGNPRPGSDAVLGLSLSSTLRAAATARTFTGR